MDNLLAVGVFEGVADLGEDSEGLLGEYLAAGYKLGEVGAPSTNSITI